MQNQKSAINLDVPERVVVIGEDYCPFCQGAKQYFEEQGIPYLYIDSGENPKARNELKNVYKWQTIPGIFIDKQFTGGYSETKAAIKSGKVKLPK